MSMTAPPVRSERLNSADHAGNGCLREAKPERGLPNSPVATRLAISTYSGQKRRTCAIMKTRSVASLARTSAWASSSERAIGFSSWTCLPAASAASATSRCCGVGRQISTASMPGSASTACRSSVHREPISRARGSPRSALGAKIAVTSTSDIAAYALACVLPMNPAPKTAIRTIGDLLISLSAITYNGPLFRHKLPDVAKRFGHGAIDLGQRRPGLALELDLDRARSIEPGIVENLEQCREIDFARTDLREVPDTDTPNLILDVHVGD